MKNQFSAECGVRSAELYSEFRIPNSEFWGWVFRSRRGVTLLEVLIVTVLLSIFFGAVYETVITGLRTASAADERETIRLELVRALDLMTREGGLASNIDNAEDQRFQFDADLDGNGTTENNINYQVSSGDLQRTYNGTTVTLVGDLSALDIDYVDSSGATLTTPVSTQATRDTIRVAEITMTATKNNETISFTSAVYLRNN